MDLSAWVWYTFLGGLAMAASVAHYRLREPPGPGRVWFGLIRGTALLVVILLIFDPVVPAGATGNPTSVVLIDGSLSMSLPVNVGSRRWDRAVEIAGTVGPDRVRIFGTGPGRELPTTDDVVPTAARTQLAPALRSALEAGAERVTVVTDGAVEDEVEARRIAAGGAVPITVRLVDDDPLGNLGLVGIEAPGWLQVGDAVAVGVVVGRVGGGGVLPDSASVTVRRGEREVARGTVPVPSPGELSRVEISLAADSPADEPVRYEVRVEPGGASPDDDVRSFYVRVGSPPPGVALVSFRPDQEPRFLVPVLERALGLPVDAWLALPGGRFIRVGTGPGAGQLADAGVVQRAVAGAGVVVLHGTDGELPRWARAALADSERLLVLPAAATPGLPVPVGAARGGEWYVDAEVPPSPVAGLLAGATAQDAPPLTRLLPLGVPAGYWAPLRARLGRRGEALPVMVVGEERGRRVAVAGGDGYWRWAFAGGAARDMYGRLWSSVVAWLMEDADDLETEAVRPLSRVVARGEPVWWDVRGGTDSVAIRVEAAGAEVVLDTSVMVESGRAVTPPLAAGHYRFRARTADGGEGAGPFTVEGYSAELLHEAAPLELAGGEGVASRPGRGRPLRTLPWGYLLVVGLLCTEWVMRWRRGLG